MNTKVGRK